MKARAERRQSDFDRLVTRELGRDTRLPAGACPHAELLAAWFDGSLPPGNPAEAGTATAPQDEAAAIEAHLADCSRCQAVVAGLARSQPEVLYVNPEAAREHAKNEGEARAGASRWAWAHAGGWTWHLRWLAPAAAAAVVLLVVANQALRVPGVPSEVQRAESQAEARAKGGQAPQRTAAGQASEFAREESKRAAADTAAAPPLPAARAKPAAQPPARSADAARDRLARAPASASDLRAESVAGERAVPPAAGVDLRAGAPAALSAPISAPTAVAAPTVDEAAAAKPRLTVVAAQAHPSTFVPGGRVGWRHARAGTVSRTDDGGVGWIDQPLPGQFLLTTLFAVSPEVCWGAGPGGALVRTVDGTSWRAVPPPVHADFVALRASDALHASVRTSDGVIYETADAGATWQRR